MESSGLLSSRDFEDNPCSTSTTQIFISEETRSQLLVDDLQKTFLEAFQKCTAVSASLDTMQSTREANGNVRATSHRSVIRDEAPGAKPTLMVNASTNGRVEKDTSNPPQGHKTKRPRHEIASENAFSSEGSNKSASGENPKTNAPMRLDTESLISMMRSRQPRSLPDGLLTVAAEESSVQSQQSALSRVQADWETHIKAMEQVLTTNTALGLPNGPISEEALELLSQMVSKLYALNTKVMHASMQEAMDTHRRNAERIESVFHGLAGVKKQRGFPRGAISK